MELFLFEFSFCQLKKKNFRLQSTNTYLPNPL